jgi:AraC-like DNA-binding protein
MPPLRYVAELRMRLASQWIGNDRIPIQTVATSLGYASQAAFSRAFKRVTGHSPGLVRFSSGAAKARLLPSQRRRAEEARQAS